MRIRESLRLDKLIEQRHDSLKQEGLGRYDLEIRLAALSILVAARRALDELGERWTEPVKVVEPLLGPRGETYTVRKTE